MGGLGAQAAGETASARFDQNEFESRGGDAEFREASADSGGARDYGVGRDESFENFVRAGNYPVAMTLLGIGCFPAQDPLNLGMMGMHGEAWVNNAIQEADLLIAVGMRFDDRVTGDLRTYAKAARKIHIEIDRAEINKNVTVDAALVGDAREVLEQLDTAHRDPRSQGLDCAAIQESKGGSAVRTFRAAGQRAPLRGARD